MGFQASPNRHSRILSIPPDMLLCIGKLPRIHLVGNSVSRGGGAVSFSSWVRAPVQLKGSLEVPLYVWFYST
jgi:hypothetical protein